MKNMKETQALLYTKENAFSNPDIGQNDRFSALPTGVIIQVCAYLTDKELGRLMQVNRTCHNKIINPMHTVGTHKIPYITYVKDERRFFSVKKNYENNQFHLSGGSKKPLAVKTFLGCAFTFLVGIPLTSATPGSPMYIIGLLLMALSLFIMGCIGYKSVKSCNDKDRLEEMERTRPGMI